MFRYDRTYPISLSSKYIHVCCSGFDPPQDSIPNYVSSIFLVLFLKNNKKYSHHCVVQKFTLPTIWYIGSLPMHSTSGMVPCSSMLSYWKQSSRISKCNNTGPSFMKGARKKKRKNNTEWHLRRIVIRLHFYMVTDLTHQETLFHFHYHSPMKQSLLR